MTITLPRTGVDWQDEQHKNLFDAFLKLEKAVDSGNDSEVEKVILFLSDYVDDHFSQEEKQMRELEYPNLVEHLGEHTRFQNMIEQIKADWFSKLDDDLAEFFEEFSDLIDGADSQTPTNLYLFLAIWFRVHIKRMDQDLGKFLIQKR